jgi:hypothetical protein
LQSIELIHWVLLSIRLHLIFLLKTHWVLNDLIDVGLDHSRGFIGATIVIGQESFNLEKSIENDLIVIVTLLEVIDDVSYILSGLLLLLLLLVMVLLRLLGGSRNLH